MTYSDVTKQSPETQAIIEQEVRALLNVSALFTAALSYTLPFKSLRSLGKILIFQRKRIKITLHLLEIHSLHC